MTLPAALAALGSHRRWMLWRVDDGIKKPVSPISGWVHDSTDQTHHVTHAEAVAASRAIKCKGVAYVFTSAERFFFIDIDKCREGNVWSQQAQQILARFPGAAVEVSQSGNGLHIFGTYTGAEPLHRCKSAVVKGLELYTSGRFVALTGTNAQGDIRIDHSGALEQLIADFFEPIESASDVQGAAGWEDRADPTWMGPADDNELIQIMFGARASLGHVLKGRASPIQLWTADAAALGVAFPDAYTSPPRPWDYSSADAALAQHLAFWTGRNTERMRRLMWASGLRREKWQTNRSYLWRTIGKACARQRDVYRGKIETPKPAAVIAPPVNADDAAVMQWLAPAQQLEFFKGCAYVRDVHRVFVADGGLLKPEQFRVMFGGFSFSMDNQNEKVTRNAWECFTESQCIKFPKVETTCFRPELKSGRIVQEEGRRLVNVYVPIETPRLMGDATPFLAHVAKLFPDDGDYAIIMAYLAALLQYPGVKFQWCPIIQGAEGNGKTILTRAISFGVGHRYTHLPNAKALGESGSTFMRGSTARYLSASKKYHSRIARIFLKRSSP